MDQPPRGGPEFCRLIEQIRRIEGHAERGQPAAAISWDDRGVGPSLAAGVLHEWFAASESGPRWVPPLCVMGHLAARAAAMAPGREVVWIGRRCWPYIRALAVLGLLNRSLFVDPPDAGSRFASIELALRCPAVAAVVAEAQGMSMAVSRRLQLAAADGGVPALLARPEQELSHLSAAAGRWRVQRVPASRPRWTVHLLRCKGMQPIPGAPRSWTVEWDHAKGALALPPDLADGPRLAPASLRYTG